MLKMKHSSMFLFLSILVPHSLSASSSTGTLTFEQFIDALSGIGVQEEPRDKYTGRFPEYNGKNYRHDCRQTLKKLEQVDLASLTSDNLEAFLGLAGENPTSKHITFLFEKDSIIWTAFSEHITEEIITECIESENYLKENLLLSFFYVYGKDARHKKQNLRKKIQVAHLEKVLSRSNDSPLFKEALFRLARRNYTLFSSNHYNQIKARAVGDDMLTAVLFRLLVSKEKYPDSARYIETGSIKSEAETLPPLPLDGDASLLIKGTFLAPNSQLTTLLNNTAPKSDTDPLEQYTGKKIHPITVALAAASAYLGSLTLTEYYHEWSSQERMEELREKVSDKEKEEDSDEKEGHFLTSEESDELDELEANRDAVRRHLVYTLFTSACTLGSWYTL